MTRIVALNVLALQMISLFFLWSLLSIILQVGVVIHEFHFRINLSSWKLQLQNACVQVKISVQKWDLSRFKSMMFYVQTGSMWGGVTEECEHSRSCALRQHFSVCAHSHSVAPYLPWILVTDGCFLLSNDGTVNGQLLQVHSELKYNKMS